MHRMLMFEDLAQDLRISLRGLLRAPMMTAAIVATVGLGIGATTVIFAAVNAALLRPLPYVDAERIVRIYTDAPPNRFRFSVADYLALQAQQTQFEKIAAYTDREMTFSAGDVAERVRGRVVTWTYFSLLGIPPAAGRDFAEADGRVGSPPAVIVSHGFWQRRLGGRTDVIGRPIRFDGAEYTLAGVLPPVVGPLEQRQEFFVAAQLATPPRRGPFLYTVLGRLSNDDLRTPAAEELRAINRRIFPIWRASYQDDRATWSLMDLKAHVVGDVRTVAGVALAAVVLVWLIACANASNLLIARVNGRRRELAVRAALGASRGRVRRYLLAESLLLAMAATAVGVAIAFAGVDLLRNFGAAYFPRTQEVAIDGTVLWLMLALTAASTLLFGLVPAVHGGGGPVEEPLRALGRSSTANRSVRRVRRILVASQFAIATPLLIIAALLLASLESLSRVDLGFDSENLLTGAISLPASQYSEAGRITAFWDEFERRVAATPGALSVAFADGRPPNGVGNFNNFELEEAPTPPGQSPPVTPWVAVSPEYFRVLGLELLEGRLLDERDGQGPALEAVVVDRAWGQRFFPGQSALGKRFRGGGCTDCPWTVVVGVVSEVKYAGLDRPDDGTVYTPLVGGTDPRARFRFVIVRTGVDAATLIPTLRGVIRELDPSLPFSQVATVDELVAQSLQRPRSLSMLVGIFAMVAVALSIIGIYGVMAYYVQQHSKDISIRLALGGSPRDVLRLVVGQGMSVVMAGVAIGLFAALMLTRWASGALFGVAPTDPVTFLAVSVMMTVVALVACLIPARRAIGLQPATVLRND